MSVSAAGPSQGAKAPSGGSAAREAASVGVQRAALVAGEASGDMLGAMLLQAMKQRWPDLQTSGIAGPRMQAQGCNAWWPQALLAVRGYAEVLPHLRKLLKIRAELGDRLLANKPNVFIGIDAPDFNFDLEKRLKAGGIPTVHFVSPSFWAWRAKKLIKLKAAADHVLCVFPFEPALLAQHGIAATYVGHPVANIVPMQPDKAAARAALGLSASDAVVAVLPGSRQAEISYLGSRFFKACRQIQQARPAIKFVVPAIPALKPQIDKLARQSGLEDALQIVSGQSHTVLAACDVTLIASGTATLEAALFKRPMVIAYNMHWLSWQIMRRKMLQPWVGLPNILCGKFVVPELLQDAATPSAMADAVLAWLDQPQRIAELQQRFVSLHNELQRDTAQLAVQAIEDTVNALGQSK
ncbi:MAG: lipid-A-disaccharide synthase [Betaproteobacteria bacterium]|jgi:lipid-A-disaccharide synthase|nr:lipid-A-disaccharide synthase [Betaproteobacteria bacterium]MBP6646501.1 lipid-A-disaccharide synthase [Burkholderiaceae bacterium]